MALTVDHAFSCLIPDDPASAAAGEVVPSDWNASHALTGRADGTQLMQGQALSVLGVAGNAVADQASIVAATDKQVMRRSGTSIGFGAIDLASSDAVTGTLSVANGGTGAGSFTAGRLLIGNGTSAVATDAGLRFDAVQQLLYTQSISAPTTGDLVIYGADGAGYTTGGRLVFTGGNSENGGGGGLEFYGGVSFNGLDAGGSYSFYPGSGLTNGRGYFFDGLGNTGIEIGDNGAASLIGFFAATPVIQPVAATALHTALSNLGLRAAGSPNDFALDFTNTATVGNVTINKVSGTVNLGAAGTTLTLTNSLITANSRMDVNFAGPPGVAATTLYYVVAAGSCTINVTTAVVNQTAISFKVIN